MEQDQCLHLHAQPACSERVCVCGDGYDTFVRLKVHLKVLSGILDRLKVWKHFAWLPIQFYGALAPSDSLYANGAMLTPL